MKKFNTLKAGVAPVALGIALLATPAFAQDATTPEDEASDDSTIIVTGTRIVSPNTTAIAPITTVTSDDIKLSGTTRTEDLLNSLPQVVAGQNSGLANGATGTATVDLRGLGPSRTLVLINGRRLMTGDPNTTTSAADLNFIPSALVKRIDVMTGGASATYGADAVAGVVNFVMDTEFTGLRLDANYGFYQHNNRNKTTPSLLDARANAGFSGFGYPKGNVADGGQYDLTAAFGANFDDGRGRVMAYVGYRKANPILQNKRDYSSCTVQSTGTPTSTGAATNLQCGGSLTNQFGTVIYFPSSTSSSTIGLLGPGTFTTGPAAVQRYNFAPTNYFQRPDERYTAGAFASYEINDAIKPYMEFMFMDDRTLAQIAPSGNFGNTLTINCDNPLMSAAQRSAICNTGWTTADEAPNLIYGMLGNFPLAYGLYQGINGVAPTAPLVYTDPTTGATYNRAFFQLLRRNVEGGPRISDLQHQAFRTVIGTKGDLGASWSYDAYYQFGRTNYSQVYSNEFSVARLTRALDVVTGPGGTPVCRSVLDGSDPNCVPYNIFGGTVSPAAVSYLSATGFLKGYTSQQVASVVFNGSLGDYGIKSPGATDGVDIALGFEYRKDSLELKADNAFSTGDLTGQGAPTKDVAGSYNVKEFFAEANVPLIQDGFVYNLSLNAGYRYSKYNISNGREFNTDTWKVAVDFAPVPDIRIRAGYNKAARVPNIQELFSPQIVALDGVTDPCSGFTITAADVGCIATGLRVGQTVSGNPAGQYNGLIGGTPSLNPEKATTKTLGVVLTPRFLPGFSASIDWFDIKVKDAIQGFGADAILAACVNDVNLFACGLVKRNAAGSLWLTSDGYVRDLQTNIGSVQTRGYEFSANYSREIGSAGRFSLSFVGTLLDKYTTDNGLTEAYDCVGYYGPTCGNPLPKWRHKVRAGFTMKNGMGLSVQWRYVGPVDIEYKNASSTLSGPYFDFANRIKSQSYIDLSFTANVGDHFQWRLGVNNLLDKEPPLTTSGRSSDGAGSGCASVQCNGNTYPGTYDTLGRYIYTGITLDF